MNRFIGFLIVALITPAVLNAQATGSARSRVGQIICPTIVDLDSGEFSRSPKKYACYRSVRLAKRAGFTPLSSNPGIQTTPTPSATVTPNPSSTPPPTPIPGQKSFSLTGLGGAVSSRFEIRELPASISYWTFGGRTQNFQILLRDANTGYLTRQLVYGTGVLSSTTAINYRGPFYLEIKTADTMNWGITVNYK